MVDSLVTAYVALGSNLADPLTQVTRACTALAALEATTLDAVAPWYRSEAIGPGEQPDFINGVVRLSTGLSPLLLLDRLQAIENAQGRQRRLRWGARTLDLDLLLYGDQVIASDRLAVPHPCIQQRNFVVYPLADLAPALIFPDGQSIGSVKSALGEAGLQRLGSAYQP